jgi:hypothetical protein
MFFYAHSCIQVFMGRHQMKESLPVMGAFWLSIAG